MMQILDTVLKKCVRFHFSLIFVIERKKVKDNGPYTSTNFGNYF